MRPVGWLTVLVALALIPALAGPAAAKTRTDRVIQDPTITESSGLAPSLLHDDVLWTHNDSGNPNEIYALAADGSTAATVTVAGEPAEDWEAITSFRAPDDAASAGQALLAIADIGDNDADRSWVRIAIVAEPQTLTDTTVEPIRVLRLTYPGGARDAEAVLADPRTGRLYVVSKTLFGSEVFAVPAKIWPGRQATGTSAVTRMTSVGQTGASLVTDGAFEPDGRMVLRGYGNLKVIAAPETAEDGQLETLASRSLPDQKQGESLAVVDDGAYALIGSEGVNSAILRVRLPQTAQVAQATGEDTRTPTTQTSVTDESGADQAVAVTEQRLHDLVGSDRRLMLAAGAGAAGLLLVVLFALTLLVRSRRTTAAARRRRRPEPGRGRR